MSEYHKIQTVFLRDPETSFKTLLDGQWSKPEFAYLADNQWEWTEKVDGTNIRIILKDGRFDLGGKTDNAILPAHLVPRLREIGERALSAGLDNMILYGEGYGAKIQKGGGNYIPTGANFVLFDVFSGMWLERANVEDIGGKLEIGSVPIIGRGRLNDAITKAAYGFESTWGPFRAEGLVCRPPVELINRRGERVITKIKSADFKRSDVR